MRGRALCDFFWRSCCHNLTPAEAFDPWDARLRTALRQGVTTLHLGANRAQIVAGVSAMTCTSTDVDVLFGLVAVICDGPAFVD